MKVRWLLVSVSVLLLGAAVLWAQDPTNFNTSLHGTRTGKAHFYSKDNGGFETLTNVAIDTLGCLSCHPANYADGTPVDAATYQPGCNDCHNFAQGTQVADEQCLSCHGRQKTEIAKMHLSDVHRDAGMGCTDCHTKREMHGDGTSYASMLEPGAMDAKCSNEGCHSTVATNTAHSIHNEAVDCSACHSQTVITCYNCHFESEVQGKVKRAYGGVKNFMLLTRRAGDNKVHASTFMALSYQGKGFYVVAPFYSHSITKEGKACNECHGTETVAKLQNNEKIKVVGWDDVNKKLVPHGGVIPVPENWSDLFEFDFLTYTGDVANPTSDMTKWEYLKTGADLNQMLFAQPLTAEQMGKLAVSVGVEEEEAIPTEFVLAQNYPNPFNPSTAIEFRLPKATQVTLKVYNLRGELVATLVSGQKYEAGIHKLEFNASQLPSGIYIYRLETPEFTKAAKMTFLK